MSKVHFIGVIHDSGDTAACGCWRPDAMTGELAAVTCVRCRRSVKWYDASRPNARRSPAHVAYRRFVGLEQSAQKDGS